jgi:LacI family transcriptional regulator
MRKKPRNLRPFFLLESSTVVYRKRVTIHEVAAAAGVHRSTVSRVLSGAGGVSPERRERVLAAAKAFNYHPDSLAGALKSRRRNTWGFLSSWYTKINSGDHFYASTLVGFLEAANEWGQRVLLQNVVGRFDEVEACLRFVNDAQLAGVVVMAPRTKENFLRELKRLHVPAVLLAYTPQDPDLSFVDVDNVAGVKRAMEYLLGKGHKRIAYVGGELELSANARDRYQGYLQALQEAYLPVDTDLIRNESFEPRFAVASLEHFLSLPQGRRPSAIFCATDAMARAVVEECLRRGLAVPGDMAVMGFDNNPAEALRLPGLSTVNFPFFEAGQRAGQLLHELAQPGAEGPRRILLPPSLVLRDTA